VVFLERDEKRRVKRGILKSKKKNSTSLEKNRFKIVKTL